MEIYRIEFNDSTMTSLIRNLAILKMSFQANALAKLGKVSDIHNSDRTWVQNMEYM